MHTIFKATSWDQEIKSNKINGTVVGVFGHAVAIRLGDRLVTLVPRKRGPGPGFILLSPQYKVRKEPDTSITGKARTEPHDGLTAGRGLGLGETLLLKEEKPSQDINFGSDFPFLREGGEVELKDYTLIIKGSGGNEKRSPHEPEYVILLGESDGFSSRIILSEFNCFDIKNINNNYFFLKEYLQKEQNKLIISSGGDVLFSLYKKMGEIMTEIREWVIEEEKNLKDENIEKNRKNRAGEGRLKDQGGEEEDELRAERFQRIVKFLVGLGVGLTPTGDDILLGMVSVAYILKSLSSRGASLSERIFDRMKVSLTPLLNKTNFISREFLRYGLEGRFTASLLDFLRGFFTSDLRESFEGMESLFRLRKYGQTSGLDILWGVLFCIELIYY